MNIAKILSQLQIVRETVESKPTVPHQQNAQKQPG